MRFLENWLLTMLLLVPAAGAAAVVAVRRSKAIRWIAIGTMLLAFVLSMLVFIPFKWRQSGGPPQLLCRGPLVPAIRFSYEVAIDGLSLPFVVLTTVMFPLLCLISWKIQTRPVRKFTALLLLEFFIVGAFLSFDFLLFCLFLVATTAAAYELLRQSAGERHTAMKLLVYLTLGITCLLVPLIGVARGGGTFDMVRLAGLVPSTASRGMFAMSVLGFLFWMAIVPLHSWLVAVVCESPAAIAICVFVPAIGGYGLFRMAGPPFGQSAQAPWTPFGALGVASILFGGLCALAQEDVKRFVAYGTTSLMGFVLLGFAVGTPAAGNGAVFLLFSQGLMAALFLYPGGIPGTDVKSEGPSAVVGLAWLAWLVAPGLLGQVIVVLGTFQAARTAPSAYGLALAALLGVLLSGAGAARLAYRLLFPQPRPL